MVELAVMGAATGLAAVLARSVPPVPDAAPAPSRVLELTGFPDPGPMTGADWFTAWRLDWLFLGTAVLAVGLYLAGVCGCAVVATGGRCCAPSAGCSAGRCSSGPPAAPPASGAACCSACTW